MARVGIENTMTTGVIVTMTVGMRTWEMTMTTWVTVDKPRSRVPHKSLMWRKAGSSHSPAKETLKVRTSLSFKPFKVPPNSKTIRKVHLFNLPAFSP